MDIIIERDDETTFKSRWEKFAAANRLPTDPDAPMPAMTVGQQRRWALEYFSWGLVHGERERRRIQQLLPFEQNGRLTVPFGRRRPAG
jgi:hypothetical protein